MREPNQRTMGTEDEVGDVGAKSATGANSTANTPGRLLRFPDQRATQGATQGATQASIAQEVAAALVALDTAMVMATQTFGVSVAWETGETSAPLPPGVTALPGTFLVAGDARRRRLVLSRAGLIALASMDTLRHAPLVVAMTVARMLHTQAGALQAVAAHVANTPTRGPSSTIEWVVAVLAVTGLRQIVVLRDTPLITPRRIRATPRAIRARQA